jgi:preprotein translocase subunit YajC
VALTNVEIGTRVLVPSGQPGRVVDVGAEPWVMVMVNEDHVERFRREELRAEWEVNG